jgi:hypothetical protein
MIPIVTDLVQCRYHERFRAAAAAHSTFVAKVDGLLDEAVRLSMADPTLALEAVEAARMRRDSWLVEVVDAGIASGEVPLVDREVMLDLLNTLVAGLIVIGTAVPAAQIGAAEGCKRLLAGRLVRSRWSVDLHANLAEPIGLGDEGVAGAEGDGGVE